MHQSAWNPLVCKHGRREPLGTSLNLGTCSAHRCHFNIRTFSCTIVNFPDRGVQYLVTLIVCLHFRFTEIKLCTSYTLTDTVMSAHMLWDLDKKTPQVNPCFGGGFTWVKQERKMTIFRQNVNPPHLTTTSRRTQQSESVSDFAPLRRWVENPHTC